MQQNIKFNGITPVQPDEDGYSAALATTSTADSGRVVAGLMKNTPMFTVEAYNLKWTDISAKEVAKILQQVLGRQSFKFYHFNIYTAKWETTDFYAANFNSPSKTLEEGEERWDELSFQVTRMDVIK